MQQGETRRLKDTVNERITLLAIRSIMAGVIQFNTHQRAHSLRITEHEIDVLLGNPGEIGHIPSGAGGKYNISQSDVRTDHGPCVNNGSEDMIERQFCGRQEIVADAVGQRLV
jgi:hypothetical protein